MNRVAVFVDGFNLYHALNDLGLPHLKWLDLDSLCRDLVPRNSRLEHVYYFTAFATWLKDPYRRHREYVKALETTGVHVVLGHFKKKDRECRICHATYPFHEEKESDVNLAIHLVRTAFQDEFDIAMVISNDSDMVPAIKMVQEHFPGKTIWSVCPPNRKHTMELQQVVRDPKCLRTIWQNRLERHLFGATVADVNGRVVAVRPAEYTPPSSP